jgi:CRISPR-associated protein Csm1
MEEAIFKAALAGLLHDVGKFAQRAGESGSRIWDDQARQDFGYFHALLSSDFVARYVPEQWCVLVKSAVSSHHRPQDDLGALVQLADWLSAGEREEDQESKYPFLLSPFARLRGHRSSAYLKPARLDPAAGNIFPTEGEPTPGLDKELYENLWRDFTADCERLKGESLSTYLEGIYSLLQEYTWCIPSAYYKAVPDVSLYDHARTTAALAACMAADGRNRAWCEGVAKAFQEGRTDGAAAREVCLLVGGDINGLQAFLYSIASENAARSLRGRSFYLQMLTEAVALFVLDQVGLPIPNLLYAGGGNFYLLAPVSKSDDMAGIQAEVTRRLLWAHEGGLRLALAWTPAAAYEFRRGIFVNSWDRLHERLRRSKERPLAELPADEVARYVGQGTGSGGELTTCPVCGREEPGLKGDERCPLCTSFEELGSQLAHATHLVVSQSQTSAESRQRIGQWWHGLEQFGVNVWAVEVRQGEKGYLPGGPAGIGLVRVYPLTPGQGGERAEEALLQEAHARGPVAISFRPFAQLVPYTWGGKGQRRIATFDELAEHSDGIARWGVLRMDVDDLGSIFRQGFRREENGQVVDNLTLSRLASLSFALRLFFEGYLPTIGQPYQEFSAAGKETPGHQAEEEGHYDKLYVQYAGGDDLFVVGAWDALPQLAADVRGEFARYVCHNPGVTLSGGITLHPARFPLYQAARQAEEAEQKKAKVYSRWRTVNGTEVEVKKDALCFLDTPLGWDEFREVRKLAEDMREWIEEGRAPRALLQHLLRLYGEWQRGQEEAARKGLLKRGQFYYGPWIWHAVYQLARTAASIKDKEVSDAIKRWINGSGKDGLLKDWTLISRLGLAARWVELWTRRQGE